MNESVYRVNENNPKNPEFLNQSVQHFFEESGVHIWNDIEFDQLMKLKQ